MGIKKNKKTTEVLHKSSLKVWKRVSVSDSQWSCFKGNTEEISDRKGGADMGFPEHIDTMSSYTELKWTGKKLHWKYDSFWQEKG